MATASNPESEVSIEEIGSEDVDAPANDNAEEIITDDSVGPREEASDQQQIVPSSRRANEDDDDDDEDDDDIEDETIMERLVGLTEMFPDSVRNGAASLTSGTISGTKKAYSMTRGLFWIVFSSAAILFLPAMIETERMGIEEAQKQQQRQILLGPGAAMSGSGGVAQNAPLPPPAM